jgi:hypothetical protein
MKKLLIPLIAIVISLSNAWAQTEVWEANITPPYAAGGSEHTHGVGYTLWFTLEIKKNADGEMFGHVDIRSPKAWCHSNVDLDSVKINDGMIKIRSKPIPKPGCGYFYFQGTVEDGKWVGYIPWNGKKNEAVFTKTK